MMLHIRADLMLAVSSLEMIKLVYKFNSFILILKPAHLEAIVSICLRVIFIYHSRTNLEIS